ncbi:MAG: diguanylate cyclase [Lachnospiraceae bacterium]|nr:diguanylate cyclase [Lachnospiraceae bacterium]
MDTYEIVYMNKKLLSEFGFKSVDQVVGRKCYELIQNCQAPCSMCNNKMLKPGEFKEWKYFNPGLNRHYMLKDTMVEEDGRRFRIEIAIDVSDQEKQKDMITNYHDMSAIVNEGIKLALHNPNPDKTIDIILEYLGKALHAERTYIFEKRSNGHDDNTYEWVATGVTPEKDNLQNVPPEACSNWYQAFKKQENVIIEDIDDIREENYMQYEILKAQNIKSIVVAPLYDEKKIIGFYGVDNPPAMYLEYSSNLLEIVGHFMESSIRRRNLLKQLKEASYSDYLTKFGNRHAMNDYIEHYLPQNKSLGIIYCDITGLKRVNDTEGHEAGDKLILNACGSMKRTLGRYNLYRVGGDEFICLCVGITNDKLQQRIEALRADMEEHSVVMAVGSAWFPDGYVDLDKAINQAEKCMYEDKLAYYEAHGIEKRLI